MSSEDIKDIFKHNPTPTTARIRGNRAGLMRGAIIPTPTGVQARSPETGDLLYTTFHYKKFYGNKEGRDKTMLEKLSPKDMPKTRCWNSRYDCSFLF
jgi:hypothetical protein